MTGKRCILAAVACLSFFLLPAAPLHAQTPSDNVIRFEVVPDSSSLVAVTGRAGLLSFLGHEHAIRATEWLPTLCLDPARPTRGWADLSVDARSLEIDSDTARALADLGDGPGEDDRAEVRAKMLGPENLAVEEHPQILVEAVSEGTGSDTPTPVSEGAGGSAEAEGVPVTVAVTVRGRRVEYDGEVDVVWRGDGSVRVRGDVEIRLRDFGIEPESVAGVVNVANEVDLLLRLGARPTQESCAPRG